MKRKLLIAVASLGIGMSTAMASTLEDHGWDLVELPVCDLSMCPVDLPAGILPDGLSFSADVFRSWESFEHIKKTPIRRQSFLSFIGDVSLAQFFGNCKPDC